MKKTLFTVLALAALISTAAAQENTLTPKEKQAGWKLLFDGKTTNGWHSYGKKDVAPIWQVKNGAIELVPGKDHPGEPGGNDLTTNDEYENFELTYQWKISPGGNSGLIFMVHESPEYKMPYLTGVEEQVLDDARHPDGKIDKHRAGDLYDLVAAPKQAANAVGTWNTGVISKKNNHVTMWLNGTKTAEITVGAPEWKKLVAGSNFYKTWKGFAAYPKGHIVLQDHGLAVWYRNVKVRQL